MRAKDMSEFTYIIDKSFSGTVSLFFEILIILIFSALFITWIFVPFILLSIKKELKNIRMLLEEKKDTINNPPHSNFY